MDAGVKPLAKQEFLEMTCIILQEVLSAQALRKALLAAAEKTGVPEADKVVSHMLAAREPPKEQAKHRGRHDKEADGNDKPKSHRGDSSYTVFVSWFSDYVANYGHNPAVKRFRESNPTLTGLALAAAYYKNLTQVQKDALKNAVTHRLELQGQRQDQQGEGNGVSKLEALKKFEAEHPDMSFGHIVGLEAKPDYKTDPTQMKAEAKRQKEEHAATPSGALRAKANGKDDDVDGQAAGPSAAKPSADAQPQGEKKRKKDAAGAEEPLASAKKSKKESKKDKEAEKPQEEAKDAAMAEAAPSAVKEEEGHKSEKKDKDRKKRKERPEEEGAKERKDKGHEDKKDKEDRKSEKKDKEDRKSEKKDEEGDKSEKKDKKDKKDKEGDKSEKKDKKDKEKDKSEKKGKKDKEDHKSEKKDKKKDKEKESAKEGEGKSAKKEKKGE